MSTNNLGQDFLTVLTGSDCRGRSSLKDAVARRATILLPSIQGRGDSNQDDYFRGYVYSGSRCRPENLGWRFIQSYGEPSPYEVLCGRWDTQIAETVHEAAAAEHWYKYEKQWD